MEDSEVIYAIGWSLVAIGALVVLLVILTRRHGYSATTAGLLLAFLGLLIAGHLWAAGALLGLTMGRYGNYLHLQKRGSHGKKEHNE